MIHFTLELQNCNIKADYTLDWEPVNHRACQNKHAHSHVVSGKALRQAFETLDKN